MVDPVAAATSQEEVIRNSNFVNGRERQNTDRKKETKRNTLPSCMRLAACPWRLCPVEWGALVFGSIIWGVFSHSNQNNQGIEISKPPIQPDKHVGICECSAEVVARASVLRICLVDVLRKLVCFCVYSVQVAVRKRFAHVLRASWSVQVALYNCLCICSA